MRYDIMTELVSEELYRVNVTIYDDNNAVLATGETHVCGNEADATAYAENVFLPDLRRNNKKLASLVLPSDAPPETPPEEGVVK